MGRSRDMQIIEKLQSSLLICVDKILVDHLEWLDATGGKVALYLYLVLLNTLPQTFNGFVVKHDLPNSRLRRRDKPARPMICDRWGVKRTIFYTKVKPGIRL